MAFGSLFSVFVLALSLMSFSKPVSLGQQADLERSTRDAQGSAPFALHQDSQSLM